MKKVKIVKEVAKPPKDDYKPPLADFFVKFYAIVEKFNTKKL